MGAVNIGATIASGTVTAIRQVTVIAGTATSLSFSNVPASVNAGDAFTVTITAKDAAGNTASSYAGTVSITSSDSAAILPSSSPLSAGAASFAITLNTAGSATLSTSSSLPTSTSTPIAVAAATTPANVAMPEWMVQITGGSVTCSGSLISDGTNQAILAPADCISGQPTNTLKIVFADNSASEVSGVQIHNSFDSRTLAFDLALITPVTPGKTPIDLNQEILNPKTVSTATLLGFDSKAAFMSWDVKVDGTSTPLKSYDSSYMALATSIKANVQGGPLVVADKSAPSGYLLAGYSFFQSDGGHVFINLSSSTVQGWIRETLISGGGGGGSSKVVATLMGAETPGIDDGGGSTSPYASFYSPLSAVEVDGSNLIIADTKNHTLRYWDRTTDQVTTIVGSAGNNGQKDSDGLSAFLDTPSGLALDPATGIIYISDAGASTIRSLVIKDGTYTISTVAGSAYSTGADDGQALRATFNSPTALAWYQGGLLILDSKNGVLRYLYRGEVTTVGDSTWFTSPNAIAVSPDGKIYVADSDDHTIKVIEGMTKATVFSGLSGQAGNTDGDSSLATFNTPRGLAVDASGTLYVSDSGNQLIRKVTSSGDVSTYAGTGSQGSPMAH